MRSPSARRVFSLSIAVSAESLLRLLPLISHNLVVLNDDTSNIDGLVLRNATELRSDGRQWNIIPGTIALGNGVGLSRLEVDPGPVTSVDTDNLQLFDGGQLHRDGGCVEVDSQPESNCGVARLVAIGMLFQG